jgi:hypothetical protein
MIQKVVSLIQSKLAAGQDYSDDCEVVAEMIDEASKSEEFYSLGPHVSCEVLSRIRMISIETAQTLIKKFHDLQGPLALELVSGIECGQIGNRSAAVLGPLLSYPLLRELSGSGVSTGSLTESERSEISSLRGRIADLESGLDWDPEVDWKMSYEQEKEKREGLEALLSETKGKTKGKKTPHPKSVAQPRNLSKTIFDACMEGDLKSVQYYASTNPSLINSHGPFSFLFLIKALHFIKFTSIFKLSHLFSSRFLIFHHFIVFFELFHWFFTISFYFCSFSLIFEGAL